MEQRENIKTDIRNTLLLFLFLLFLMSLNNSDSGKTYQGKNGISSENILSQCNAITNTDSPLIINHKSWASDLKYPDYRKFYGGLIVETRKILSLISRQQVILGDNSFGPTLIFCFFHFPQEKDDIPLVS
jgi:hypothetical protein